MGPQQVLRVAVALAALAGVAQAAPVVAIVDARPAGDPATATALAEALTAAELEVLTGDRAAALRGQADDDRAADAALAEAADGFGQLDCGRARPSAELAVRLLAARTAAGHDERPRAARAWSYVLLCADRDGDRPVAHHAADRLRGLGGGPAVGADVWARYPEIDAALDRDVVALTVTGPAGAVATLDDRRLGPVPATTWVAAGKHVVAVAGPTGAGATWITVMGQPLAIEVPPTPPRDPIAQAWATAVRGWQTGSAPAAADVAELARAHAVELVVVLEADGAIAAWRHDGDGATRLARGDQAAAVAAARAAYAAAHERAPDPTIPLEREAPKKPTEPTRWWVYAAIGGALAAGAIAIYAADAGEDRQRFVLEF